MCSGRPVEADCWRAKSSGDCDPSPWAACIPVKVAAFFIHRDELAAGDLSQRIARALGFAHVLGEQTGLAWLTFASTSPVTEWTLDRIRGFRKLPSEIGIFTITI